MKTEFLFQVPGQKDYLDFRGLMEHMTRRLSDQVIGDFKRMDNIMIEAFDNRLAEQVNHGSMGRFSLRTLILKFR